MTKETITTDNQIEMYFHCGQCMNEKPDNVSPRAWAQIEAGWTVHGLQVWCKRHNFNIINVDFQGQKHPAICTRKA